MQNRGGKSGPPGEEVIKTASPEDTEGIRRESRGKGA